MREETPCYSSITLQRPKVDSAVVDDQLLGEPDLGLPTMSRVDDQGFGGAGCGFTKSVSCRTSPEGQSDMRAFVHATVPHTLNGVMLGGEACLPVEDDAMYETYKRMPSSIPKIPRPCAMLQNSKHAPNWMEVIEAERTTINTEPLTIRSSPEPTGNAPRHSRSNSRPSLSGAPLCRPHDVGFDLSIFSRVALLTVYTIFNGLKRSISNPFHQAQGRSS